jgi:hypothetical protein
MLSFSQFTVTNDGNLDSSLSGNNHNHNNVKTPSVAAANPATTTTPPANGKDNKGNLNKGAPNAGSKGSNSASPRSLFISPAVWEWQQVLFHHCLRLGGHSLSSWRIPW